MFKQKLMMSLTFCAIAGCSSNKSEQSAPPQAVSGTNKSLTLQMKGLEPMVGQHYEGWIVGTNSVVTTGRFNIEANGDVVSVNTDGVKLVKIGDKMSADFSYDSNAGDEGLFILTIEPNGDSDSKPSAIHYLAGDFSAKVALASVSHAASLNQSFLSVSGGYILATPTNGASTDNQGIWFIDPQAGAASLNIPQLSSQWQYEGWIVNTQTGGVYSTGTFMNASGLDSDAAGSTAGSGGSPPFPGQDYITPAKILNDGNHLVVVSVEPVPDFDPTPFAIKILAHPIALNAAVGTLIGLGNIVMGADISVTATLQ